MLTERSAASRLLTFYAIGRMDSGDSGHEVTYYPIACHWFVSTFGEFGKKCEAAYNSAL